MAWYVVVLIVGVVMGAVLVARLITKKWFVFKM